MNFPTPSRIAIGILLSAPLAFASPTLTKLHDFLSRPITPPDDMNPPPGIRNPYDSPILIGSELWFTSQAGGAFFEGTLSSYDLTNNTPTVRYSLGDVIVGDPLADPPVPDITFGRSPQGTPVLSDGVLYYTTNTGGSGNRGTLNAYNMSTGVNTLLWTALPGTPAANAINPGTLPGNVVVIDRGGALGKDLYFVTSNGGSGGAGIGTILRYQTSDGSVAVVHHFGEAPLARQPFKGFTVVGTKLYFTTFTGGNSGTGTTNGAGTLNQLDVTTRGAEVYQKLASLPLGDGSTRLAGHNPYYRAADNSLYFTTAGTSLQPGSLQKYNLTTHALTTLHEIQSAATASGPYPEGRFIYGPVNEWRGSLYFTTIQGGTTGNGGTINRYNLQHGYHEVLFNLDSSTADNFGGEARGGFVFNENPANPAFFLLTRQGGVNDHGTLLKLNLLANDSAYETWLASYPTLTGPLAGPSSDKDGDGYSNSIEFAFGTHPDDGTNSNPSAVTNTPAGLEIRWTARTDSSVTYTVTGSPTLGAAPSPWTHVGATIETLTVPDVTVPAGYERRSMTIPAAEAKGFFRVEGTFSGTALP